MFMIFVKPDGSLHIWPIEAYEAIKPAFLQQRLCMSIEAADQQERFMRAHRIEKPGEELVEGFSYGRG